MKKNPIILSLFDGMSCCQIALNKFNGLTVYVIAHIFNQLTWE